MDHPNENDDEDDDDDEDGRTKEQRSKTKKSITGKRNYRWTKRKYNYRVIIGISYIISFTVLVLMAEGFFIFEFLTRNKFYKNLDDFAAIYFSTCREESGYMEVLDVYREHYANPENTYGRTVALSSTVSQYWNTLYKLSKDFTAVRSPYQYRMIRKRVRC